MIYACVDLELMILLFANYCCICTHVWTSVGYILLAGSIYCWIYIVGHFDCWINIVGHFVCWINILLNIYCWSFCLLDRSIYCWIYKPSCCCSLKHAGKKYASIWHINRVLQGHGTRLIGHIMPRGAV
uniref:Uncharacterized protein n=1 Tax=Triticum urartu TaxID=4572 RepID=A0A8R7V9R2_TRIUA